jgi:hypothetical protein
VTDSIAVYMKGEDLTHKIHLVQVEGFDAFRRGHL